MQFKVGTWYRGLLSGSPVTLQAVAFNDSGTLVRAKVFKTFYAGKMLTTEEWLGVESLVDFQEVQAPTE